VTGRRPGCAAVAAAVLGLVALVLVPGGGLALYLTLR
jgi:hypothetical protein